MNWLLGLIRLIPSTIPGKLRLARLLLKSIITSSPGSVTTRGGLSLEVPSTKEPVSFHIMVNGVYEPETMKFLRQNADSADTFFDVGANVGYFGLSLKLEFPKLDIVAIEASPAVFPYLEKNRENAGLSVLCVQKVICETTGDEKPFYLPSNDHFGMGSLNADIGQGPPALVESISLDELSRDLNWDARVLIKVDVEGYEYAVFAGGSKLLSRSVSPTIIFEFCDWAEDAAAGIEIGGAQQVLKQFGYQIWRLSDYMAGKPPLEANLKTGTDMLVAAKPGSR